MLKRFWTISWKLRQHKGFCVSILFDALRCALSRTCKKQIKSQLLCQLSYAPIVAYMTVPLADNSNIGARDTCAVQSSPPLLEFASHPGRDR